MTVTVFCFSRQTFVLLVLYKAEKGWSTKRAYSILILVYPIIMTSLLAIVSLLDNSIKPKILNCDVTSPAAIRIVAIIFDMTLGSLGIWYSARAAFAIYSHLSSFRAFIGRASLSLAPKTKENSGSSTSLTNYDTFTSIPLEDIQNSSDNNIEIKHPISEASTPTSKYNHIKINRSFSGTSTPTSNDNNIINSRSFSGTSTQTPTLPQSIYDPSRMRSRKNSKNVTEPREDILSEDIIVHAQINRNLNRETTNTTITNAAAEENRKRYVVTRAAAIRMILFCVIFAVVNSVNSFQTIILVIHNTEYDMKQLNMVDWVASILGILVFLVFVSSRDIQAASSRKTKISTKSKLTECLKWSRRKSSALSSSGMSIQSNVVVSEFNSLEEGLSQS
ncbi:1918_t:CDS:2 [Ambispora leptoticha]|uniref:1918_t:CDS:1 n=1 Tax=Ambispora leptoticha TaxID=144679 RepID=A0A9N9C416_9GLOM|nr:1918_t:CDS:2 [Ambispora leptoticha]